MTKKQRGPLILVGADERLLRRLARHLEPLGREIATVKEGDEAPLPEADLALIVNGTPLPKGLTSRATMNVDLSLPAAELREAVRLRLGLGGHGALCLEARSFIEEGRLVEAEATLRLAISRAPAGAEAFFLMGQILEKNGSPFEAQENYATALVLDESHREAKEALARITGDGEG